MKTLCARNAERGTERTQELARIGKLRANCGQIGFEIWGAAAAKKKQGSPLMRAIIYETHGDDCIITHDTTRRYERSDPLSLRYHTLIALNGAESVLKSGSFRPTPRLQQHSPGAATRSFSVPPILFCSFFPPSATYAIFRVFQKFNRNSNFPLFFTPSKSKVVLILYMLLLLNRAHTALLKALLNYYL